MALSDSELLIISREILNGPQDLAAANAAKTAAINAKATFLEKDNGHLVFYNRYKTNISSYSSERSAMSGTSYTAYLDSYLEDSAKLLPGNLHYPDSPFWTNLVPKVIPSNNGTPTSTVSSESSISPALSESISILISGFSDGAQSANTNSNYTPGSGTLDVDTIVGFSAGNRIKVGTAMIAKIISVGLTSFQIEEIGPPASTISSGASVTCIWPGVPNAQRESGAIVDASLFAAMSSGISSKVTSWDGFLTAQNSAISSSLVSGSELTNNNTAIVNNNAAKSEISAWVAKPATGVSFAGKWSDDSLGVLTARITTRSGEITSRDSQIVSALGSVTQNPDGSYSGTGHFKSLFTWIDQRITKGIGTLLRYYNSDKAIAFSDQKIAAINTKLSEYNAIMVVKKIVSFIAVDEVQLTDVIGLAVSQSIKIIDEDSPSSSFTITGISGNNVTLNNPVSGFTTEQVARLIREL